MDFQMFLVESEKYTIAGSEGDIGLRAANYALFW